MYIPHENMCMDWLNMEVNYIAGYALRGRECAYEAGARRTSR